QCSRGAHPRHVHDIPPLAVTDISFLADPRILTQLDDLMASAPSDADDDLLATDLTTFDVSMWAVPWTADTMALVYRPDVLEKFGIAETPQDWEELADVAARITEDSGGEVSGFVLPAGAQFSSAQWFPINYYLWAHGTQLIQADGEQWTVALHEIE